MTTTSRGGGGKEKNGNAARVNSSRGIILHMMDAEVSTSINFPYLPRKGGWNDVYRVSNDSFYMPV
jgi:hypothetical protein